MNTAKSHELQDKSRKSVAVQTTQKTLNPNINALLTNKSSVDSQLVGRVEDGKLLRSGVRASDFHHIKAVSVEQMTTLEAQYTDVRGNISKVVRGQKGFTHVHNKNGDFLAISVDAFKGFIEQGVLLVKADDSSDGDNMAMYHGTGQPYIDLLSPKIRKRSAEISDARHRAVEVIMSTGVQQNEEHSG
jgi:hypothetical protein